MHGSNDPQLHPLHQLPHQRLKRIIANLGLLQLTQEPNEQRSILLVPYDHRWGPLPSPSEPDPGYVSSSCL